MVKFLVRNINLILNNGGNNMTIDDLRGKEWWIVEKDRNEPIKIKVRHSDNFLYVPCACKLFTTEEEAKEFIAKRDIILKITNSIGALYRLDLDTLESLYNKLFK